MENNTDRLLLVLLDKFGETLMLSEKDEDRRILGDMLAVLADKGIILTAKGMGVAGQYYYYTGDNAMMEYCLNEADSGFGKENRFGTYRSIYRGLLHYNQAPGHYDKQIHNALFFLRENREPLPYLKPGDKKHLTALGQQGAGGAQALIVRTQGEFSVRAAKDGQLLPWRTRKGRELFAYLLEMEGEPVSRDRLMEVLWPEEIPENAVSQIHNMIYNMRKELSAYCLEQVVIYEKKHYRLSMDSLASDSLLVHRMIQPVQERDLDVLQREEDYFLQYNGRYLRDIDSQWANRCGDFADEIFQSGCRLLAEQAAQDGNLEKAVRLYGNILLVSPYEESAAAKLLLCYGRMRKWKKLQDFYQGFTGLLHTDLGIKPGRDVVQAYQKAMDGNDARAE